MDQPVIDFHCDLLAFLAQDEKNTPLNPEPNCSLPLLNEAVYPKNFSVYNGVVA